MDVITLHQAGFTNAVAGLGTALTDEQVRLISRYCEKVYLSYDNDAAGHEALQKAIQKFEKTGLQIHPLIMQGGKDPDEVIKKFGAERFKSIIDGASNEIEYKLSECKQGLDISSDDGRIKYLRRAVPILANLSGAIERDVYTSRLSEELGVSKEAISLQIKEEEKRIIRKNKKMDFSSLNREFAGDKAPKTASGDSGMKVLKAEETIVASLLNNPDFLKKLNTELTTEDFTGDFYRHAFAVLQDRIQKGQSVDFIYLSSEFSPEDMSRLTWLQNGNQLISNTLKEIEDCVRVIKSEKQRIKMQDLKPSDLNDDDFLKLFDLQKNE